LTFNRETCSAFAIRARRKQRLATLATTAFALVAISPAAKSSSTGKHFLWRVTNAPAPFYLLGSMHALRGPDYPLPPEIDRAIADSRKVIFETNPEAKDAPLLRRKLHAAGHYSKGVTIDQKVSAETFARLKRMADVRLSVYEDIKPWAIAFFMLEQPDAINFSSRLSVDRYVRNKTRNRVEIGGLETVDEFVHALADMSDAESEAFLLEAIAYGDRFSQLFPETIVAWKSGDTQRMYRLYAPPRTRNSGYWHWLYRRQANWIPRIEEAIGSGKPTVVVAGALHFCGPRSVLTMLRARGYRLEQL
jgi:uncharacterized protein YbaP (TraB family)